MVQIDHQKTQVAYTHKLIIIIILGMVYTIQSWIREGYLSLQIQM